MENEIGFVGHAKFQMEITISFGGLKFLKLRALLLKITQNVHISKYKNGDGRYKNG